MKLSVLVLLAVILSAATSIEVEASQYLYDTLIATPKQCLQQYCSSDITALLENPEFQSCKTQCEKNTTCWEYCLQNVPNQTLLNLYVCIGQNGCEFWNAFNQIYEIIDVLGVCELLCWYPQFNSQAGELQACSNNCGADQVCWGNCPRSTVIQNAIIYNQCFINFGCYPPGYYQPLYNPKCLNSYCSSQCEAVSNNPELHEVQECLLQCGGSKSCWTSCIPQNQQQNLNQCIQCANQNNCKQTYYF